MIRNPEVAKLVPMLLSGERRGGEGGWACGAQLRPGAALAAFPALPTVSHGQALLTLMRACRLTPPPHPTRAAGIADPTNHNKACLDTLLATVFVNTVDAPSLALIIPVVHRGLRDRSGGFDGRKGFSYAPGCLCTWAC